MDPRYLSPVNRDVPLARPGEFRPLVVGAPERGGIVAWPPVVLAPMARRREAACRTLCRGFGARLYGSEMITARGLLERNAKTLDLDAIAAHEKPRSLQPHRVHPLSLGEALASLVGEGRVDHVD